MLSVSSIVYDQFSEEIEAVIRETLTELGETDVKVTANDRGARWTALIAPEWRLPFSVGKEAIDNEKKHVFLLPETARTFYSTLIFSALTA